jgi:hypothetical protein
VALPRPTRVVKRRLEQCLARWPPPLGRALGRYLASRPGWPRGHRPSAAAGLQDRYYWLQLPVWLAAQATRRRRAAARAWLPDVLWAQYRLFLFVRIHDDLVDEQGAREPLLVFVADRLLLDAETDLARHLARGAWWFRCRRLIADSLDAIAQVDGLERRGGGAERAWLDLYARVSAVLKVGAAAACALSGQQARWPLVARFADQIAVANQILDDLVDIDEDLARGRVNFAAAVVAGPPALGRASRGPLRAQLARRGVPIDRVARLVSEARGRLARARRAAAALRLDEAVKYVDELDAGVHRLDARLHRVRVAQLFGGRSPRLTAAPRRSACRL